MGRGLPRHATREPRWIGRIRALSPIYAARNSESDPLYRFGAECYVTDSYNGLLHGQVMCPQRTASQLVNIWLEKDQQGL